MSHSFFILQVPVRDNRTHWNCTIFFRPNFYPEVSLSRNRVLATGSLFPICCMDCSRSCSSPHTIVHFILYDTVSQSHKSDLSVSATQLVCSIRPAGCNDILFSMCCSLFSPERERIKSVILKES